MEILEYFKLAEPYELTIRKSFIHHNSIELILTNRGYNIARAIHIDQLSSATVDLIALNIKDMKSKQLRENKWIEQARGLLREGN